MHLRSLLLVGTVLLAVAASAPAAVLTGPVTNPANGHAYFLLTQDTWTNSEAEAVTLGGHLATINDAAENAFVFNTFNGFAGPSRNLWIGLNDADMEGTFVWSSGDPLIYTNWQPGQPSGSTGPGSSLPDSGVDYVYMTRPGTAGVPGGRWFDSFNLTIALNNAVNAGVVEVVPEPATAGLLGAAGLLALLRRRRSKTTGRAALPPVAAGLAVLLVFAAAQTARADLFVSTSLNNGEVLRFDADTGAFKSVFANGGGLSFPLGLAFGPGGDLFVASRSNEVFRYDATTGVSKGVFASGGGLNFPFGLAFGPGGDLFVASRSNEVLRYDGVTGAFEGIFASGSELNGPVGLAFGPDGDLFVANGNNNRVLRYDGTSGAFEGIIASDGGFGLTFGPGGDLFVASIVSDQVLRYDGTTGAFEGVFASGGGLSAPRDLAFGPDGDLFVNSARNNQVLRYDGVTGAFESVFASGGRLSNPTFLAFTPVPEPSSLALLGLGGLVLLRRRRSKQRDRGGKRIVPLAVAGCVGTLVFAVAQSARADLFVSSNVGTGEVLRYDNTGTFVGIFASGGELRSPKGLAFGPGGDLFVASTPNGNNQILRYDVTTGAFKGVFASGGGLSSANGLTFGTDGDLFVSSRESGTNGGGQILRYDGTTGAFEGIFASGNGLTFSSGLTFGTDGDLFATNASNAGRVLRYDGVTGAFKSTFVPTGLDIPFGLTFGPDGDLFVSNSAATQVVRFDGVTGASKGVFASGGGLSAPRDLTFGPDGDLFVVGAGSNNVVRFDGITGASEGVFTGPGRPLSSPTFLAFTPVPEPSSLALLGLGGLALLRRRRLKMTGRAALPLVAAGLALGLAGTADAAVLSGPVTNPANGHDYYLLTQDTWTNSESQAVALGGHLATINDAAENTYVFNTFAAFGGTNRNLWIGFNDVAVEGTFVWTSGETPGYTNWSPGQPDNTIYTTGPEPDEDYVLIVGPQGFSGLTPSQWNDGRSDPALFSSVTGPVNAVVEVVPEPAAGLLATAGLLVLLRRRR